MEFIKGLRKLGFKTLVIPKRCSVKMMLAKEDVDHITDSTTFYELIATNDYEKAFIKIFDKGLKINIA